MSRSTNTFSLINTPEEISIAIYDARRSVGNAMEAMTGVEILKTGLVSTSGLLSWIHASAWVIGKRTRLSAKDIVKPLSP
jgi:hypothetical protein